MLKGIIASLISWLRPLFLQPKMPFTFAAKAHCLCSNYCLPMPLGLFQQSCSPSSLSPACIVARGYSFPKCRTLHSFLLNFTRFFLAHFSNLSRSLWMAAVPLSLLQQQVLRCLQVTDKDIKQDTSQNRLLQYSTCYRSSGGAWPIKHCSLSPIIQPGFLPI